MKTLTALLVMLIFFASSASCAITNKFGPYSGKVVDTETKEPIAGAAVLVVFFTEEYGPAGAITRFADAIEAVTDKNGEFKINASRVTIFRPLQGWDVHGHFWIFRPEYGCYPEHKNVKPMFIPNGTLPANQYVTIELPKLQIREERLRNIDCYPLGVPDEKMEKLIELNNIESVNLGLRPTHVKKEKK